MLLSQGEYRNLSLDTKDLVHEVSLYRTCIRHGHTAQTRQYSAEILRCCSGLAGLTGSQEEINIFITSSMKTIIKRLFSHLLISLFQHRCPRCRPPTFCVTLRPAALDRPVPSDRTPCRGIFPAPKRR